MKPSLPSEPGLAEQQITVTQHTAVGVTVTTGTGMRLGREWISLFKGLGLGKVFTEKVLELGLKNMSRHSLG